MTSLMPPEVGEPRGEKGGKSKELWPRTIRPKLLDICRSMLFWRGGPSDYAFLREARAKSGLPRALATIIDTTSRKARLWAREEADLRRELAAHFQDGLDAGQSEESLAQLFGDPVVSAKLIRKAKLRNRPWLHRTLVKIAQVAGIGFACLVVAYVGLGVYLWSKEPKITRRFIDDFNARITAFPKESTALENYIAVLNAIGPVPEDLWQQVVDDKGFAVGTDNPRYDTYPQKPGDPRWPALVKWLDANRNGIDLLHRTTQLPHAGTGLYSTTPSGPGKIDISQFTLASSSNTQLVEVLLPMLAHYRALARILAADARLAVERGDAERFVANISALLGIARHAGEDRLLISQLVQIAILTLAYDELEQVLALPMLDEQHLTQLGHLVAQDSDASLAIDMQSEREFFLDFMQRAYSDDGNGGGVLTLEGLRQMHRLSAMTSTPVGSTNELSVMSRLSLPMLVAVSAGRKELTEMAMTMYDQFEKRSRTDPWKIINASTPFDSLDARIVKMNSSLWSKVRHFPLTLLLPAMDKAVSSAASVRQERWAMLLAIGLEAHKRAKGHYPTSTSELVPAILPSVAKDSYTGLPLAVVYVQDRSGTSWPVIYSVGRDQLDDGGKRPPEEGAAYEVERLVLQPKMNLDQVDARLVHRFRGDWVLHDPARLAQRLTMQQAEQFPSRR